MAQVFGALYPESSCPREDQVIVNLRWIVTPKLFSQFHNLLCHDCQSTISLHFAAGAVKRCCDAASDAPKKDFACYPLDGNFVQRVSVYLPWKPSCRT